MSLPIRTTLDDVDAVCGYLVTKPTGATLAEAKAVVAKKHLDGRKLTALRFWGLIEYEQDKVKITDRGRRSVRDSGSSRSDVLRDVVREVPPYVGLVERVVHRRETTITAIEVAAHWHEHFRDQVSESDKTLNDQAVCFFQVAQGADLGTLKIGRKGQPTRFDFDADIARAFIDKPTTTEEAVATEQQTEAGDDSEANEAVDESAHTHEAVEESPDSRESAPDNNRVFITHGENTKILGQVKELVTYGKFHPVVAMEHETSAKPVPQKVMSDMRTCRAAVIHVSSETVLVDHEGTQVPQINGNVLIEIGAAMALYGDKFVLLVEEGLDLPSNLQGLYECRYSGDELNMTAIMKLLKALSEF